MTTQIFRQAKQRLIASAVAELDGANVFLGKALTRCPFRKFATSLGSVVSASARHKSFAGKGRNWRMTYEMDI
jgi:hypothetical protein